MGNFSRNTFDPLKDYVAVRLQQGVPVLDADWNELNDVTRQELYDAFSLTFTDGIPPEALILKFWSRPDRMTSHSGRGGPDPGTAGSCATRTCATLPSPGQTRSAPRATAWR